MNAPRSSWFAPPRALVLYVGTIVVPGLVLIYLGIQGVLQQQSALESLIHTGERLSGEQMVNEIEQRVREQADACLGDAQRSGAIAALDRGDDPHAQRQVRTALASVVQRQPIASAVFLFQDGVLRFPLLRTPLPRSLESMAAEEPASERREVIRLLALAEEVELREGDPQRADRLYGNAFDLAVTAPVRALALARRARCADNAGDCGAARQLFRRLAAEFSDEYDPYGQPYALSGLLYLSDGSPTCPFGSAEGRNRLMPWLREVPAGRWELSADLADYYIDELQRRSNTVPVLSSPYLRQFKVAEAFSRVIGRYGALDPGDLHEESVVADDEHHQVIYERVDGEPPTAHQTIIALVVDLDWVRATLVPSLARKLDMRPPVVMPARALPSPDGASSFSGAEVAFRTYFPFWQIAPSPETVAEDRATVTRGSWVLGGSTIVVLGMLVAGVVLLTRDIRREAEVAKVKANLVSGVSHELKTPLTVIRLYAETLSADPRASVEERLDYYDIITRESERLTTLIDKVLDFSRIERGQKTYQLAVGDLRRVVEETLGSYEAYLRRRGFVVERDIRRTHAISFDADAVAEALVNLLDNAVKYSSDAQWIKVSLVARDDDVALEVEDRGVGIAESDRERIFGQFFRAGRQTGTGGYGLGLFLVKHIMDAHGGRIEVESEQGTGSLFRLVFPVARPAVDGVEVNAAATAGDTAQA